MNPSDQMDTNVEMFGKSQSGTFNPDAPPCINIDIFITDSNKK